MIDLKGWQPARGTRSVVQVELRLAFYDPLPRRAFEDTVASFRELRESVGLPYEGNVGDMKLTVTPSPEIEEATLETRTLGIFFAAHPDSPGGSRIELQRNGVSIVDLEYDGWLAFRTRTSRIFADVLTPYSELLDISEIALSYTNVFVDMSGSMGLPAPAAGVVLDRNSPFLNARTFQEGEFWHCRLGWFEPSDGPRSLLNVDTDVASAQVAGDDGGFRERRIMRVGLREAVRFEPSTDDLSTAGGLTDILERIHRGLKDRYGSLLTEDARSAIGLYEGESQGV